MSATAVGMFDNLRYARWLLNHADELPKLVAFYEAFKAAESVRQKWHDGVRPAGDLIVDIVDTLPAAGVSEAIALGDVQAQALRLGVNWEKVLELSEKFLPLVVDLVIRLRA